MGTSWATRRRLEHLFCAHSGSDREGTAVPADRATCPCRFVLLGRRCLVLRRRIRSDFYRFGLCTYGRTGGVHLRICRLDGMATFSTHRGERGDGTKRWTCVLGGWTGPRGSGHTALRLVLGTGRWRRSCSCFRTTGRRPRCRAPSRGWRPGEPSGLAHFLTSLGTSSAVAAAGPRGCWRRGPWSLVSGPSLFRWPDPFLAAGGCSRRLLLGDRSGSGGHPHGFGHRPETGPLVVLLALTMAPARVPDPATWARRSQPHSDTRRWWWRWGGSVLWWGSSSVPPIRSPPRSRPARPWAACPACPEDLSGSGRGTASTATCTSGNNGSTRSGLDVTNTPNMPWAGPATIMNMNGGDASAAAGLNTTKENWHYTGPALPQRRPRSSWPTAGTVPPTSTWRSTGCAPEPTFSQQINATQYVQNTSQAAAALRDPSRLWRPVTSRCHRRTTPSSTT